MSPNTKTLAERRAAAAAEGQIGSKQVTEYLVLREVEPNTSPASWEEVGKTTALNATQAIAKLVGSEPEANAHVATPVRSWRPVRPTVKVEKRVVWS